MTLDTQQFSSVQEERWSEIRDFPGYAVSDRGRVQNLKFNRLVTPTTNSNGVTIVGLMYQGRQHKKSLPLLIADEFVPRPQNLAFDTPTHRDGDRTNNDYTNLMWRPLWFNRKYMAQFTDGHYTINQPIEDIETGEIYKTSMDASMVNGVLDIHIVEAMYNNTYVWPTGQIFREPV